MTTVAIAEAHSRLNELLHRSRRGEHFIVTEGAEMLACLGPVPAKARAAGNIDFVAQARALRERLKHDPTPIKQDIEEGRL